MTRGIINRDWARRVAHEGGVQISEDALALLDESAEGMLEEAVARAKAIGRKRVDSKVVRGLR